jgi:cytochrome c oxidase subunit 4
MKSVADHIHITPIKIYLGIGLSLLLLTAVTVSVSFIHLGGWNAVVAVLIATLKALLVALFFMHLIYDRKIYFVVFSIALVFVSIFLAFTMFDVLRRGDIYEVRSHPIESRAKMYENMPVDTSGIEHNTGH